MSGDVRQTPQERFCDVGEFVVGCFTADGKTYPHVGSQAVGERIVRCRDCRYYKTNTYSHFTCELLTFHVEPDGFCAWGERGAK